MVAFAMTYKMAAVLTEYLTDALFVLGHQ
jgi:hypothetical protein